MSKRTVEVEKLVDKTKLYKIEEAIEILKQAKKTKFDETVELHIRLGIDPKKSDQSVRGTVVLPYGVGKTRTIAVVAKGEKIKEAEAAGADFAGSDDLIEKISKGWMEFDTLVATPDAMKDLSKLGKLLGPKGLMPNPKAGTVTFDIAKAVKELKGGRIEFKIDEYAILHLPAGKLSFDSNNIARNIRTIIEAVIKAKPAAFKGIYLVSISMSSTMGPGLKLDLSQKFTAE